MTQEEIRYEDDTISLVDLLAVVVRHRRLIILGTLAVAVLAILYAYAGPRFGVGASPVASFTAEQRIVVSPLPEAVAEHVAFDTVAVVKESLQGNGATVSETRSGNTVSYTVSVTAADGEAARAELQDAVAAFSLRFGATVEESLTPLRSAYDAAIAQGKLTITDISAEVLSSEGATGQGSQPVLNYLEAFGTAGVQTLVETITLRNRINGFIENPASLVAVLEPTPAAGVESNGSNPSTVIIIATITAFFLMVFTAFVLEYIRRVRMDPEEVGKLRAAWQRK
jgi:hypothetical protein